MINYKHLLYFWAVAREGGVARASELLHVTPQTISGQLRLLEEQLGVSLFNRVGRNLEISDSGRTVFSYADEIFSLGSELQEAVSRLPHDRPQVFRVGVVDVLPKSITHRILAPALQSSLGVRMECREANLDTLLGELVMHRIDLLLADRAIPPTVSARGFSHKLGECGHSFFASGGLLEALEDDFPNCLNGAPMLMPSRGTQLRSEIDSWMDRHRIYPRIAAEFDDSALLKAFGKGSAGIFMAPAAIEKEVEQQYSVTAIGQVEDIRERFYAITVERKVTHPLVSAVLENARGSLFAGDGP